MEMVSTEELTVLGGRDADGVIPYAGRAVAAVRLSDDPGLGTAAEGDRDPKTDSSVAQPL
ncbi:hypothetical protein thsrh120_37630 [Rhizobium sp. No.120]